MIKICEICENKFETKSATRIYCYECSGESTRTNYETRKYIINKDKKEKR